MPISRNHDFAKMQPDMLLKKYRIKKSFMVNLLIFFNCLPGRSEVPVSFLIFNVIWRGVI
jgi:hypothetical protein